MRKKQHKAIYDAYNHARDLAMDEVEYQARKILREHPKLDYFFMAMGMWGFTIKGSDEDITGYDKHKYLDPLKAVLNTWDHEFKLTGDGVKFTATGPRDYNW